jgi:tRNA A-37 threonylcarbamoyl transferase component Bud32
MLATGQIVDRYTVEGVIGAGGTAVVYRVRHAQLQTPHALKVLSLASSAIRRRMLREGQVQATMRHPNVVAVTDVLDIDGAPGLLMEHVEGPSLEQALARFSLDVDQALTLFHGVVAGVRHAHMHGLVHRDLKPANVLLARTEQGFVPKVTDFGLAKVIQGDGPALGQTRQGVAMGTPAYMAPEQIRDARTVDQRADLFSLGCLLYELVCGVRTFPGNEAIAIYNAIMGGDYIPPRRHRPDLPDRVDQAIRGMLMTDRDRRIPDCDTLLAVLAGERTWDMLPEEGDDLELGAQGRADARGLARRRVVVFGIVRRGAADGVVGVGAWRHVDGRHAGARARRLGGAELARRRRRARGLDGPRRGSAAAGRCYAAAHPGGRRRSWCRSRSRGSVPGSGAPPRAPRLGDEAAAPCSGARGGRGRALALGSEARRDHRRWGVARAHPAQARPQPGHPQGEGRVGHLGRRVPRGGAGR